MPVDLKSPSSQRGPDENISRSVTEQIAFPQPAKLEKRPIPTIWKLDMEKGDWNKRVDAECRTIENV